MFSFAFQIPRLSRGIIVCLRHPIFLCFRDGAGLYLQNDLQQGLSRWSETYDNDVLVPNCAFDIAILEVWTVREGN